MNRRMLSEILNYIRDTNFALPLRKNLLGQVTRKFGKE